MKPFSGWSPEGGNTISRLGFDQAWDEVKGVDGWLTREQGRALYEAASTARTGEWIVEIGSHHGKSTILLARGAPVSARVLAIDPFEDPRWGGGERSYEVFLGNLRAARVDHMVTHWRKPSSEASRVWSGDPVAVLYVDGAHDRDSVRLDLAGWEPFVREQGFVLVHDAYSSPGVTVAMLERHFWSRFGTIARVLLDSSATPAATSPTEGRNGHVLRYTAGEPAPKGKNHGAWTETPLSFRGCRFVPEDSWLSRVHSRPQLAGLPTCHRSPA